MPPVRQLLGVAAVWHDSGADLASQRFVLWASRLLEATEATDAYHQVLRPAAEPEAVSDAASGADTNRSSSGAAAANGSGASANGSSIGGGAAAKGSGGGVANGSGAGAAAFCADTAGGAPLPVSVLVHCDADGPPVELLASRRLLQVGPLLCGLCSSHSLDGQP